MGCYYLSISNVQWRLLWPFLIMCPDKKVAWSICVSMNGHSFFFSGMWDIWYIKGHFDRPCLIHFEIISDPVCKPGWFYLTSHGCYNIVWETKLHNDAQQSCVQEGGHLIAWETGAEFEAIRDFLWSATTCKYSCSAVRSSFANTYHLSVGCRKFTTSLTFCGCKYPPMPLTATKV